MTIGDPSLGRDSTFGRGEAHLSGAIAPVEMSPSTPSAAPEPERHDVLERDDSSESVGLVVRAIHW